MSTNEVIRGWNSFLNKLKVNPSVEKIRLSNDQIDEICKEIEHQWLHLVITRAVFPNAHFPHQKKYSSPNFYSSLGIQFSIEIHTPDTQNFKLAASKLNNWHNKNYVIRLYGILEKYQILRSGRKAYKDELMELIWLLRPKIGAHNSGGMPRSKDDIKDLKKATRLINKLFPQEGGKEYNVDTVDDYWLPIDGVLQKMKNQAIEFVRSLK